MACVKKSKQSNKSDAGLAKYDKYISHRVSLVAKVACPYFASVVNLAEIWKTAFKLWCLSLFHTPTI